MPATASTGTATATSRNRSWMNMCASAWVRLDGTQGTQAQPRPSAQHPAPRALNLHIRMSGQIGQEVREVVRVLFLDRQDAFEHPLGRGVVVADVVDHRAVAVDGDAL